MLIERSGEDDISVKIRKAKPHLQRGKTFHEREGIASAKALGQSWSWLV